MAYVPPRNGVYVCERCGRDAENPEGWLQITVQEKGEEEQQHDFCAVCKQTVRRELKRLTPKAPKAGS